MPSVTRVHQAQTAWYTWYTWAGVRRYTWYTWTVHLIHVDTPGGGGRDRASRWCRRPAAELSETQNKIEDGHVIGPAGRPRESGGGARA